MNMNVKGKEKRKEVMAMEVDDHRLAVTITKWAHLYPV